MTTGVRAPAGRAAGLLRRVLPAGLTGLAGTACAACCAIPVLLIAGVVTGTGWATVARLLPPIAIALAAAAGLTWWWARRRRYAAGCAHGNCSCESQATRRVPEGTTVRSMS